MTTPPQSDTVVEVKAGRELDVLVAEKIFGASINEAEHLTYMTLPGERPISDQRAVPCYSTNIEAAFQVVDRMRADAWYVDMEDSVQLTEGPWWCEFARSRYVARGEGKGNSLPLAICLAALKAAEAFHA